MILSYVEKKQNWDTTTTDVDDDDDDDDTSLYSSLSR